MLIGVTPDAPAPCWNVFKGFPPLRYYNFRKFWERKMLKLYWNVLMRCSTPKLCSPPGLQRRKRLGACRGHFMGISFSGSYLKCEIRVEESKHTSGLKTWWDALEKQMEEIVDCPLRVMFFCLLSIALDGRRRFSAGKRLCRGSKEK